jgi:hypothetical protein
MRRIAPPGTAVEMAIVGAGAAGRTPADGEPEVIMKANVGDRLILEGTHVGEPRRVGVITGVRHHDGAPPYTVRWLDSGHEALVFPGPDARVEPPTASATGAVQHGGAR